MNKIKLSSVGNFGCYPATMTADSVQMILYKGKSMLVRATTTVSGVKAVTLQQAKCREN